MVGQRSRLGGYGAGNKGGQIKIWLVAGHRTRVGGYGAVNTGDHPINWRATNPRTGGRPTQELAGVRLNPKKGMETWPEGTNEHIFFLAPVAEKKLAARERSFFWPFWPEVKIIAPKRDNQWLWLRLWLHFFRFQPFGVNLLVVASVASTC